MRVDILLWSLRYFKSRNIASQACKSGRIKILGKSIKPSKEIFIGDKISINKNKTLKDITVLKLPKKRIGAKIIDLHRKEELIIKNSSKINDKTISIKRIKGSGRPTKKERREIDKYSVK
ncbi:MAG: S4 domain-containing protein [Flavobacteriaceae bacterium]|jgi:ribosome-associated heat shock protein Hsp15|nr:S4 domain-containing protein [Flavobacteriaceae bacterium]